MLIEQLCQRLNYSFLDETLLHTALTHSSVGIANNQRLEFLGDAVLGLVVGEYVYNTYENLSEGELTRFRSSLVCHKMLAKLARDIRLADLLYVRSDIPRERLTTCDSVLEDALEAVIGAVYLDGGFESCKQCVLLLIAPYASEEAGLRQRDAKSRLQEILQGRRQSPPQYTITATSGKPHEPQFTVTCKIKGVEDVFIGHGRSKRQAEQEAAERAVAFLI